MRTNVIIGGCVIALAGGIGLALMMTRSMVEKAGGREIVVPAELPTHPPTNAPIVANTEGGENLTASLSENGKTILLMDSKHELRTKWEQDKVSDNHEKVVSLAFSPNGSRLAAIYEDGYVHLWNVGMREDADWRFGWEVLPTRKRAGRRHIVEYADYAEVVKGAEVKYSVVKIDEAERVGSYRLEERYTEGVGYSLIVKDVTVDDGIP